MSDDVSNPPEPTLRRVCSELIALRERTDRQHRLFEQALSQNRADVGARFERFAADIREAFQRLREELTGEKRYSLSLLNALTDLALDLQRVAAAEGTETVAVAARRAEALLTQFGVHRYDAIVGSAYQPSLHERVGCQRVDGLAPLQVARQVEPGYASRLPDFVIRRAKVLIGE